MPLTREFLIEQGSCCGCGCLNCPYTPKHEIGSTEIEGEKMDTYRSTNSGLVFDFVNPTEDMVDIEDVAHALSHLCRFTGHCDRFYSVAEHSLIGALIFMERGDDELAFEFLMHDAHEAYVGDLSTNLKKLCPDFKIIEERVDKLIRRKYNMANEMSSEVKQMDIKMLATEKSNLLYNHRFSDWAVLNNIDTLNEDLRDSNLSMQQVRQLFIDTFDMLMQTTGRNYAK
jgi:5'-deoxynucleotidase YfbR-like HD superfamily hydrolase